MIEVKIPNYLRRVKLSDSRNATYFSTSDVLPEKYRAKRYGWKRRTPKEISLFDGEEKMFVIKNPKSVGTPSYQSIAGNEIYARMHERKRILLVDTLKDHFKEHMKNLDIPADYFPLSEKMELHSSFGFADWDVDNLWIYHKCFLDSLRDLKIVPDDNVLFIRQAGETTFVPVTEEEIPTMIFKLAPAPKETIPVVTNSLTVEESSAGEPGSFSIKGDVATIYTGKKKIIFGAAKQAIRSVMHYALNNFKTVFVDAEMYHRYKAFFDDNKFEGHVTLIIVNS